LSGFIVSMSVAIDAAFFQEKVRICLQLARALPWNSPARYQLLLMAEDLQLREKELEGHDGVATREAKREEDWGSPRWIKSKSRSRQP
jgi:hypothetical protein